MARVLTFGYNANVLQNVNTGRIAIHAKDLLEKLVVQRVSAKESIYFFIP